MTIATDTLRSGISALSAHSRIVIRDNEVCKAGVKQRFACRFSTTDARRANIETINALKTAALNDPRYAGIRDKVELAFKEINANHSIRAKDVKKVFAGLDKCAFDTESGKKSFIGQEVKMRLLASTVITSGGKEKPMSNDEWAFSFKSEWKSGPDVGELRQNMNLWAPHLKKLEPLIMKMVDDLAAEKGGAANITASDARNISINVYRMLTLMTQTLLTTRNLPSKHHAAAIALTAKTLATSKESISSPDAVLNTADNISFILEELEASERSRDGIQHTVEHGIAWMNAMCAPLTHYGTLTVFLRDPAAFAEATKLGLAPDEAKRLTELVDQESSRTLRSSDVSYDLMNENSYPRQLLNFPELSKNASSYRTAVKFIQRFDGENLDPDTKNKLLTGLSALSQGKNDIPMTGSLEATTSGGELIRFEWDKNTGAFDNLNMSRFGKVA